MADEEKPDDLEERQEKRQAKTKRKQSDEDRRTEARRDILRHLIESEEIPAGNSGLLLLAWLLEITGLYRNEFLPMEQMYHRNGEKNIGARILAELKVSSPRWLNVIQQIEGNKDG